MDGPLQELVGCDWNDPNQKIPSTSLFLYLFISKGPSAKNCAVETLQRCYV